MEALPRKLLLRWGGHTGLLATGIWGILIAGIFAGWWQMRVAWIFYIFCTVVFTIIVTTCVNTLRERQIREAPLPRFLQRKLREAYPHLSAKDCELVERGLRQFFVACLRSRRKFVAMPSQAVDRLWHEFILHTQAYRHWCRDALGFFLHHTPAEALGQQAKHNDGLRRAWYWACKDEAIDPQAPTRLPLLFALDAKLIIANGFHYVPDCNAPTPRQEGEGAPVHCGTSFGDGSHSGNSDNFGGTASSDGDNGGPDGCDGGGCGGD